MTTKVVAEKFQAMVELGMGNSRMKDFFDLWVMGHKFEFEGDLLARAIRATFERRQIAVPVNSPLALTSTFHSDPGKQTQWSAFLKRVRPQSSTALPGLGEVVPFLEGFLMPAAGGRRELPIHLASRWSLVAEEIRLRLMHVRQTCTLTVKSQECPSIGGAMSKRNVWDKVARGA